MTLSRRNPGVVRGFFVIVAILLVVGFLTASAPASAGSGSVSGRITDPDGLNGVGNVNLTLRTSNWMTSYNAYTSTDGTFTFSGVTPGDYLLSIWTYNQSYFAPADLSVTVADDQAVSLGDVHLVNPNFFCKVTQPDGTTGVANASVTVRTADWMISKYASTDANGNCQTALTSSGTYTIEVYTYDSTYSRPENITFSYTAGDTTYYDGTHASSPLIMRSAALRGQLKLPNGSAAQYASIQLIDSTGMSIQWASSDMDGNFKIDAVTTGTYTLKIQPPYSSNGLASPAPITVSLTSGVTDTTYLTTPIMFTESVKTITGTVKRTNGVAVTNANVYAWKVMGGGYASTTTDGNGAFLFKASEGGTWEVSAYPIWSEYSTPDWAYSGTPKRVEFSLPDTQAESIDVPISVETFSATLSGTVRLPDGTAVPSGQYWSVSAWRDYGAGNWSQTTNGQYTMKLAPGTYTVSAYGPSNDYGAPQLTITVKEGEVLMKDIIMLEKNATISGSVKDTQGHSVASQWCSAWMKNGSGWASASSDTSGNFSMKVTAGTWMVNCYPSGGYSASSAMRIQSSSMSYVATDPPQEVAVTANGTATANFVFALADATIEGKIVDATGTKLSNIYGWLNVRKCTQTTDSAQFWYSGLGGSISAGTFSLRVPSGICWKLGASLPYGADYSATTTTTAEVTPTAGETVSDVTLTVVQNNATIKGKFLDSNGNTLTDVYGSVFATNGVAYQWSQLVNGEYSMKVSADTWQLGCWVDYSTSQQYYMNGLCERSVTVAADETNTQDFVLQTADSTITVNTVDANGAALANGLVKATTSFGAAKTVSYSMYGSWFNRDNYTDQNGTATLKVPAGTYIISASLPPDLGYINPEPEVVTASADSPGNVTLRFRTPDAHITGTVTTSSGAAYTSGATVTAYTATGAYSETEAGTDGTYDLPILKEEGKWYVEAANDADETTGLSSPETPVTVSEAVTTANLALTETTTMPVGTTSSFSTNTQQEVALSDGTSITMPANSLASQNTSVTVSVTPSVEEGANIATDAQVGETVYDISATVASGNNAGQPITNLAGTATVCLPYSESELTADGLSESDVTVKTWNESAGTYDEVQNVVVDENRNLACATTNHFTKFAVTAAPVEKTQALPDSPADRDEDDAPIITPEVQKLSTKQLVVLVSMKDIPWIYLYNADGKLAKKFKPFGSTKGRATLQTADLTGDGVEELIVSRTVNKKTVVRALSLAAKSLWTVSVQSATLTATLADLNADSMSEIILASTKGKSISVYGYSGGKIRKLMTFKDSTKAAGGTRVIVGNVYGTASNELILEHVGTKPSVAVYAVNLAKKKAQRLGSMASFSADHLNVYALNVTGDSHAEIVVQAPQKLYVLSALAKLKLLTKKTIASNAVISSGDMNGDGLREILVSSKSGKGSIQALTLSKNKLVAASSMRRNIGSGVESGTMVVSDVDADGTAEAIVAQGSTMKVYRLTNGKLILVASATVGSKKSKVEYELLTTDLDGNGRKEIVTIPNGGSPTLTVYKFRNNAFTKDKQIVVNAKYRGQYELATASLD